MKDTPNNSRQSATRAFIAILLSVVLGFFLADAGVSLLDDTLILGLGVHALGVIREATSALLVLMSILVYLLSGVTPMIPKRFVLPLVLFTPVVQLAVIPLLIFDYDRLQHIAWVISLCQVLLGLGVLFWVQGTLRFRWPVFRPEQLGNKTFGWRHLSGFVLVNVLVLLPGVLLYLAVCTSLAVDHFSGGFLALRWDGLAVRAKTFVRDDNKTIRLVPMMHIGEAGFYRQISKSLPTNSVILLEGVTDNKNLIKHKLRYQRTARSLGLAEQQEKFVPTQGRLRDADVDVEQFSERSIDFIDQVGLVHSQGWSLESLQKLIQYSDDPRILDQLVDDLLTKRNAHLLKQIEAELPGSDVIVVPWGAAHMPGIAEGIQKRGFHLSASQEYQTVHFRAVWNHLFAAKKK